MTPDQPPKEIKKSREPAHLVEIVKAEKFGIQRFGGQLLLFIPQAKVDALGLKAIEKLAEGIYTKEVLDKFAGLRGQYEYSFYLELPPQATKGSWDEKTWDEADDRVERLMVAIDKAVAKKSR